MYMYMRTCDTTILMKCTTPKNHINHLSVGARVCVHNLMKTYSRDRGGQTDAHYGRATKSGKFEVSQNE